jgi:hypothetical protein
MRMLTTTCSVTLWGVAFSPDRAEVAVAERYSAATHSARC